MLAHLRNNYRAIKKTWRACKGEELLQKPQVRCRTKTLGTDGAAWTICLDGLSVNSVIYSFGVGEEISFDLELISTLGATVHAFDPTPKSIGWVEANELPCQFVFHSYGIAADDGTRRFVPPVNPNHVSHTLLERNSPWPAVEAQVFRLSSIMQTLRHQKVDVLKMDIEGAEYEVLEDVLNANIAIGQLLVEFHHRWPEIGVDRTRRALRELNSAGYQIFSVSPSGEEYGLIKISD